jgi:hypothetical protein
MEVARIAREVMDERTFGMHDLRANHADRIVMAQPRAVDEVSTQTSER